MRIVQIPRHLFFAFAAASCLQAGTDSAWALTDEEIFRDFRFNLANSGARALGMGGASVAVVDDATAIQANPAGLSSFPDPQLFAEFRTAKNDTSISRSAFGSLAVDPVTGARDLPFLALTSVADEKTASDLTFLSFAFPFTLGGAGRRLSVAGSRQIVLSQDRSLRSTREGTDARFSFDSFPNTVGAAGLEAYSVQTPVSGGGSAEIVYWNAAASLEVHRDFSVGVALTYATLAFEQNTSTEVVDPLQLFLDSSHPRLPAQPTTDVHQTLIDDADSDFAYAIGLHWHPVSVFSGGETPWMFGAVFRKGAGFSVLESTFLNGLQDEAFQNRITVPDRFALGVSYRAGARWVGTVELERIEYSDLLEGFRSRVNFLTSDRLAGGAFGTDPASSIEFRVDDGTIFRAGAEYVLAAGGRRISLRAGYYRTPDSRVRMSRFNSDDPDVNSVYLGAFRGGEEQDHFTAGVGLSFGPSTFQIAGEAADEGYQVVGSYILSFGKQWTRP